MEIRLTEHLPLLRSAFFLFSNWFSHRRQRKRQIFLVFRLNSTFASVCPNSFLRLSFSSVWRRLKFSFSIFFLLECGIESMKFKLKTQFFVAFPTSTQSETKHNREKALLAESRLESMPIKRFHRVRSTKTIWNPSESLTDFCSIVFFEFSSFYRCFIWFFSGRIHLRPRIPLDRPKELFTKGNFFVLRILVSVRLHFIRRIDSSVFSFVKNHRRVKLSFTISSNKSVTSSMKVSSTAKEL